jgi:hypothetical protein
MGFAYHIWNDGTWKDKKEDLENLCLLVSRGYVAFAPDGFDGLTTVYRPFELGTRLIGKPSRSEYRAKCFGGPWEC